MSENDEGTDEPTAESLEERLAAAEEAVEAAETEADLDAVEEDLDAIEADLEAADLPEPEDEEEEGPREELESHLADVRDLVADARGPYAEDVADEIGSAGSAIEGDQWTREGVEQLESAVATFGDDVAEQVDFDADHPTADYETDEEPWVEGGDLEELTEYLDAAADAVTDAGLDADAESETIAALLGATETLGDDVEAAESWSDLSVRDQLDEHGYYDVLDHRKDFPPEWGALKVWEQENRPDMILLAMEKLESDFMEGHCFDALRRMGPEEALEPMLDMADKRNQDAIRVLGKIGSEEALDTLTEYADADDPLLRKVTLKALGEIGSHESTQAVADQLAADDPEVRSQAARALGLLGDPRAIEPLADVLADDDENEVRGAAAWALNQIGTEAALDELAAYRDDRAYLVQTEAEKAETA